MRIWHYGRAAEILRRWIEPFGSEVDVVRRHGSEDTREAQNEIR